MIKRNLLSIILSLSLVAQLSACSRQDTHIKPDQAGIGEVPKSPQDRSDENNNTDKSDRNLEQRVTLADARDHLQNRFRLKPDKRFCIALSLINKFFTRRTIQTSMNFVDNRWQVAVEGQAIGNFSEFPTFSEQLEVLSYYAKLLNAKKPLELTDGIVGAREPLNLAPNKLLETSSQADKSWTQAPFLDEALTDNSLSPAELKRGSDALVMLEFESMDLMERADDLAARAWAMVVITQLICKDAQARNACLLAMSAGYWREAKELCKHLPASDPLRLCLEERREELALLAKQVKATQETKFLYAKLLSHVNDRKAWYDYIKSLDQDKSMTLPILSTFNDLAAEESMVPYGTLLMAATINEVQNKGRQEHGIDLKNLTWTEDKLSDSLDWMLHDLLKQVELDLTKFQVPEDSLFIDKSTIKEYYRGYFYSAVFVLVSGYLRMPFARDACSKFADSLHFSGDPVALELEKWIRCRSTARTEANTTDSLDHLLLSFTELGVPSMCTVYIDAGNFREVSDVNQHLIVGQHLFRFADTRPTQRMTLAHIAEQSILYFKESKKLSQAAQACGSLSSLDYRALRFGINSQLSRQIIEQFFRHQGLLDEFKKQYGKTAAVSSNVLHNEHLSVTEKLHVLNFFTHKSDNAEINTEYKNLLQRYPDNWRLVSQYCQFLLERNQPDQARQIVSHWLSSSSKQQDERLRAIALESVCLTKSHNPKAALKLLESTSDRDDNNCLRAKILALQELGRADESEFWAKELIKMYRESPQSALLAASVFWKNQKYDLAAMVLRNPLFAATDWYAAIGPVFLTTFRNRNEEARKAVTAMARVDLNGLDKLGEISRYCKDAGNSRLAFEILSSTNATGSQQSNRLVHAYICRKNLEGKKKALQWIELEVPAQYRVELAAEAFRLDQPELLWDFMPTDSADEELWLFRAAAWVLNPLEASKMTELTNYFASGKGINGKIGRYLLDLKGSNELFTWSFSETEITKVAYYVGWKQLCQGTNFLDESEWYFLSVNQVNDSVDQEREWSWNALKTTEEALLSYNITLEFVNLKGWKILKHERSDLDWIKSQGTNIDSWQ